MNNIDPYTAGTDRLMKDRIMATQSSISDIYKEYDIKDYLDRFPHNNAVKDLIEDFLFSKYIAERLVNYHEELKAAEADEPEYEEDPDSKHDEMMQKIADDNLFSGV